MTSCFGNARGELVGGGRSARAGGGSGEIFTAEGAESAEGEWGKKKRDDSARCLIVGMGGRGWPMILGDFAAG
jgi:hypothetical protein